MLGAPGVYWDEKMTWGSSLALLEIIILSSQRMGHCQNYVHTLLQGLGTLEDRALNFS